MRQIRQARDRVLRQGSEPQACHRIARQIADHRPQGMIEAEFGIAVRDEKQHGKMRDAPPDELDQIQRGFICPVDIFEHHDGGERTLLELLEKSGEQHWTLRGATHERRQAAPRLGSDIVKWSKRAWGKERFAGTPELSDCAAMLAHKLLYQRRFADPSLSADQHRAPIAGRGRVQEYRQLIEIMVTFE
jgi:hypothetical protein